MRYLNQELMLYKILHTIEYKANDLDINLEHYKLITFNTDIVDKDIYKY